MILAELTAHISRCLQAAVAAGELPPSVAVLTADGTWRQPAGAAATAPAPGTYVTSLPFQLARLTAEPPAAATARLAADVARLPWVSATRQDGGYLSITVSPARLAAIPAAIVAVGPAAARSGALASQHLTAPRLPDLAREPTWAHAWRSQHRALLGRLADAAGADVQFSEGERMPATPSGIWASDRTPAAALAYFGADAVRYALARVPGSSQSAIEAQMNRPLDVSNPFVLLRHAHAEAASARRRADELKLTSVLPAPARHPLAAGAGPQLAELRLIDRLSWLPERVAAAARRRRPADLTGYLEATAGAWIDCAHRFPALPFGGDGAPAEPAGILAMARLELAEAVRTVLAAGLDLLAVTAPVRI